MFNYHNFDEVFSFDPQCSYDEAAIQSIDEHRKRLEGLFLDKVLKILQIKRPTKFYPPKTSGDLKNLHREIVNSTGGDDHKISVLYYILLDFDGPTGRRDYSTEFEQKSFLPQKYQIYMKGLWHLDRLQFEKALEYLTHPSLIPTFPEEILEVLVRQAKDDDLSIALAYYYNVQPKLATSRAIESLFSAIARTSVTEAFYFTRGQPEHLQRHMFEMLIAVVLKNSSKHTIAERSVELINLPLNQEEETWFEDYLLRGEGRAIRKGRDTLMMRRMGTGDFAGALALKDINSRAIDGVDWRTLGDAIEDGLGPRVSS